MNPILLAVLIVTVIGLIGAVILVAASIFMYVPVDERVEQITGCLPGANWPARSPPSWAWRLAPPSP